MAEFTRLDEVYAQIRNYPVCSETKLRRTESLLENIAITEALIYDKLNEISKKLDSTS